ncbi:MAG: response regulator [Pseudomonadota bacterium]
MPTLSFHDVVEAAVELAAPRASQSGLALHCRIEPACKELFEFDAWCVTQLLSNLLSNALGNTTNGSVEVLADCGETEQGTRFSMEVRDTGPGIPAEIRKIMFTLPDQREAIANAQRVGYGLVISRQLCELINAELTIDQPETGGTIARVKGVFGNKQGDRSGEHPLPDALRNSHALIIDHDIAARRLLEAHLRSWDINVSTELDIASGITTLRNRKAQGRLIGMVFVSADTPRSALATFVDMLRTSPEFKDILLVMLGDDSTTGSFATLSGPLANMTLSKPVRASALFDCISRHPQVRAIVSGPAGSDDPDAPTRVLLVEDNVVNQCVATEILNRIGVQVEVANHGGEALRALDQAPFDFVFMDCQMPEMDGFEATRRIREQGRFRDLPIVALTANALSGDRQRCLDAGMSDYLTKPFTKEQLETMLDKWTTREMTNIIDTLSHSDTVIVDLIDESALLQIQMLDVEGDTTIFDEILDEYLNSSEELTSKIAAAARDGDCKEVSRCAHALKSSSAAVGLAHFSSQCSELEALASEQAVEAVRALWATAFETFKRSIVALAERRSKRVA